MNNLYFGIIIGVFLYFAGSRFLVVLIKALKERKASEQEKTEENMRLMVDKVMGEFEKKRR